MATRPEWVYVWTWLPGSTEPVPGAVRWNGPLGEFAYATSYLDRADRMPLAPEVPLVEGWVPPADGLTLHGCLRDALPDAWGQQVLRTELPDAYLSGNEDHADMLGSGTDRFGAIDFQASDQVYVPRTATATLDELHGAADLIEAGEALPRGLDTALLHGTSIGGARPKALLHDADTGVSYIAKFSSTSDRGLPVVNAEAACLDLAHRVGITAARHRLINSLGKDVLLVERFDRDSHGHRFHTVSALTVLGLDPLAGRYATYPDIYEALMNAGAPAQTGLELFNRIVLNVAISNFDDHARNHAMFWSDGSLLLTPAYDPAPSHRSGDTAEQVLAINQDGNRRSTFTTCINASGVYGLTRSQAADSVDRIVTIIREQWNHVADQARLTSVERSNLFGRQILNPAAFHA